MDNFQRLFEVIGVLARKRRQAGDRGFAALGLNHTDARILTMLDQQGGTASQEALSQMIHIDRSNVGRSLKRLEEEGYVARNASATDKRANLIAATKKGRNVIKQITEVRARIAAGFFGDLTHEEAGEVERLLRKAVNS
jgi:DNA-binding MarR family transcriptional regulator